MGVRAQLAAWRLGRLLEHAPAPPHPIRSGTGLSLTLKLEGSSAIAFTSQPLHSSCGVSAINSQQSAVGGCAAKEHTANRLHYRPPSTPPCCSQIPTPLRHCSWWGCSSCQQALQALCSCAVVAFAGERSERRLHMGAPAHLTTLRPPNGRRNRVTWPKERACPQCREFKGYSPPQIRSCLVRCHCPPSASLLPISRWWQCQHCRVRRHCPPSASQHPASLWVQRRHCQAPGDCPHSAAGSVPAAPGTPPAPPKTPSRL